MSLAPRSLCPTDRMSPVILSAHWRVKKAAGTSRGLGSVSSQSRRLLGAQDRVLGGLGNAEADLLALGDHLLLPRVGAEAHDHLARRPVDELELADAGDGE